MIRLCLFLCSFGFAFGLNLKAQAAKRMSYTSPDGSNSMVLERLARADLDSSASGYIYQSDGVGPPMIVELGPQPFSQLSEGYKPLLHAPQEFVKGGGSQDGLSHFANFGESGEKGYNGFDDFHKGLLKNFQKKQDSGYYHNGAAEKKGHHDVANFHGGFEKSSKGESGLKHGEESSHKKGHKTTGYHNVYHKDEYKKEHSFYDESEKSGHHDTFGKGVAAQSSQQGGHSSGGHYNSGSSEGEQGKKGFYNKGHDEEESEGFRGAKGKNAFFNEGSEYAKSNDGAFHKRFGFGKPIYNF